VKRELEVLKVGFIILGFGCTLHAAYT